MYLIVYITSIHGPISNESTVLLRYFVIADSNSVCDEFDDDELNNNSRTCSFFCSSKA